MFIEAVTVCVNYADFLAEAIPININLFDRWIIVTTPKDHETRELCRRWGLYCLLTDDFTKDGEEFNKGKGIIRGLDQMAGKGWVLHIDADMVLPLRFKHALGLAHLDQQCLYGIDRVMVKGWKQWQELKHSGYLQHDYHCRVNFPPGLEVGSRWASGHYGYAPIGAFQLWYACTDLYRGLHTRPYSAQHNDAARGDIQHALQWDRKHRVLLPEVVGVHLESEPGHLGVNWKGRKTKRFAAPKK